MTDCDIHRVTAVSLQLWFHRLNCQTTNTQENTSFTWGTKCICVSPLSLSLSFSQHHHSYFHTSWCLFVSHFKWGCRWKDSCMSVKTLNQMSVLIDKLVHSNLHSTLAGRNIWWHMWTHSGQLTVCGYSPTVLAEKVVFSFTAASMVTVKNMSLKQEPSRFGLQSNRFAE